MCDPDDISSIYDFTGHEDQDFSEFAIVPEDFDLLVEN